MKLDKTFYDEAYFHGGSKGYGDYSYHPRWMDVARWVKSRWQPTSVLDVGCAKGFLVQELRMLGVEAYGVDISEYAVNAAP